jgi:integrase
MSVYKRGDKNVFYMNFTINGVRVFKSTGCYTKKEAKQVEANERQKLLDDEKMTPQERAARSLFSEAIAQVYQARWKNNKDGEFSHARALKIMEVIGDVALEQINQDLVEEYTIKLDNTGILPSTVNRYLAILKTILRHKKQPWDFIRLRKERKGRIRVISREEEVQVVNSLRREHKSIRRASFSQMADMVEVLVDTGMRLGELRNIRYEDINFDTGLITIWINKGDRPRSIPMTKRVRSILESRKTGNPVKPFCLTEWQCENAWKFARMTVGLTRDKEFVIHACRHTTATRLINNGIDLYVVKEFLGHGSIQMTERYAHLSPNKLAQAIKMLEI